MRELIDEMELVHTKAGTTVTLTHRLRVPSDQAPIQT